MRARVVESEASGHVIEAPPRQPVDGLTDTPSRIPAAGTLGSAPWGWIGTWALALGSQDPPALL